MTKEEKADLSHEHLALIVPTLKLRSLSTEELKLLETKVETALKDTICQLGKTITKEAQKGV